MARSRSSSVSSRRRRFGLDMSRLSQAQTLLWAQVPAPVSSVGAEAASRLATEVARGDEVLQQRRGGEPAITELEVELTLDGQGDVETDRVEKLERAHRVGAAGLHGGVDLIGAGIVRL